MLTLQTGVAVGAELCTADPTSPSPTGSGPQGCGADPTSPPGSTTTALQSTQSSIRPLTNTLYSTPSTEQKTPNDKKKKKNQPQTPIARFVFFSFPLLCAFYLALVLGSNIAAAMGAQPERGRMGEGIFFIIFFFIFFASSSPPPRPGLFWQSQTPDVRSASWEVLLAPLGAEGRGKARELEPGVLSHCRTWRIPQLAAGTFPGSLLAICSKKTLSEPHHHSGYNTASSC